MKIISAILRCLLSVSTIASIVSSSASAGICTQFSLVEQAAITNTCGAAVNYLFFLKNTSTLISLEHAARSQLSDSHFLLLSSECLVNYKKLVCSQIYLKCEPGVIISNTSTYNTKIYHSSLGSYPVPFTRPCQKVCTNVVDSCYGLLNPNCSARFDYSSGNFDVTHPPMQYDMSNDAAMCNTVPASFGVASSSEPYLFQQSGACAGLVTEVFIPPGSLLSPALIYLSPPYFVQSIIESSLVESFSRIPVFISSECHLALRKYFCGSALLKPQVQTLSGAMVASGLDPSLYFLPPSLLSSIFNIPQYPDHSVCVDYASKCAAFVASANQSALVPQCDSTIPSTTVKKFPSSTQVVNYAVLPLTPKNLSQSTLMAPVYMFSEPNTFLLADDRGYRTKCPEGWVVPDNPGSPRNRMIPGTGCAFACRFPIWTIKEYRFFDSLVQVLSAIGLPMTLYFVVVGLLDTKRRRTQYLRIIYTISALALSIYILAVSGDPNKYLCKDNATGYTYSEDGANVCTMQAVLIFFGGLVNAVAWMMLSIDLFLKLVMGMHSTTHHLPYHLVMIYVVPAIYTAVIVVTGTAEFGYLESSSAAYCSLSSKWDSDFYYFFIPMIVVNGIGVLTGVFVVLVIIRSIRRSQSIKQPSLKRYLVLRTPLVFLTTFVSLWSAIFAFRFLYVSSDAKANLIIWTACVFKTFDGTETWKDMCGPIMSGRPSFTFNVFALTFISGQGIIIVSIFKGGSVISSINSFLCRERDTDVKRVHVCSTSDINVAVTITSVKDNKTASEHLAI